MHHGSRGPLFLSSRLGERRRGGEEEGLFKVNVVRTEEEEEVRERERERERESFIRKTMSIPWCPGRDPPV